MRDIGLFLVTGYCCMAGLTRPMVGMLAYIAFSLAAPYSLTWGPARTFPHVLLIAMCTIVGIFLSGERKSFPRQKEAFAFVGLWIVFGISTLSAFRPAAALPGFLSISKSFLMVLLSTILINNEQRVCLLARVIALSLGFYGLKIGLFVLRTGGQGAVFGPDNSFLEANNSLGMALAMNVPLLFYVAKTDSLRWIRRIARAMLVCSYPAVIGTFSRGAWLGLAAATSLLVWKSKHHVLAVVAASLLLVTSPLWISYVISEQVAQRYDTLKNYEEDGSAESRFWNWTFCTRVGLGNPVIGAGFNFYSPEAYAIYYPEFRDKYPDKVWSCHNTWLSMLAEHGLSGFFLWFVLLGSAFCTLRQLKKRARERAELLWLSKLCPVMQIAIASYAVSSTFVDVGYYEGVYFMIVVVIGMKEVVRRQQASMSLMPTALQVVAPHDGIVAVRN